MKKLLDNIVRVIYTLAVYGTRGSETAKFKKHKLKFWFFGWRLYKIWSANTKKQFYIITDLPLPNYTYKVFTIGGGIQRLTDHLFIWRQK